MLSFRTPGEAEAAGCWDSPRHTESHDLICQLFEDVIFIPVEELPLFYLKKYNRALHIDDDDSDRLATLIPSLVRGIKTHSFRNNTFLFFTLTRRRHAYRNRQSDCTATTIRYRLLRLCGITVPRQLLAGMYCKAYGLLRFPIDNADTDEPIKNMFQMIRWAAGGQDELVIDDQTLAPALGFDEVDDRQLMPIIVPVDTSDWPRYDGPPWTDNDDGQPGTDDDEPVARTTVSDASGQLSRDNHSVCAGLPSGIAFQPAIVHWTQMPNGHLAISTMPVVTSVTMPMSFPNVMLTNSSQQPSDGMVVRTRGEKRAREGRRSANFEDDDRRNCPRIQNLSEQTSDSSPSQKLTMEERCPALAELVLGETQDRSSALLLASSLSTQTHPKKRKPWPESGDVTTDDFKSSKSFRFEPISFTTTPAEPRPPAVPSSVTAFSLRGTTLSSATAPSSYTTTAIADPLTTYNPTLGPPLTAHQAEQLGREDAIANPVAIRRVLRCFEDVHFVLALFLQHHYLHKYGRLLQYESKLTTLVCSHSSGKIKPINFGPSTLLTLADRPLLAHLTTRTPLPCRVLRDRALRLCSSPVNGRVLEAMYKQVYGALPAFPLVDETAGGDRIADWKELVEQVTTELRRKNLWEVRVRGLRVDEDRAEGEGQAPLIERLEDEDEVRGRKMAEASVAGNVEVKLDGAMVGGPEPLRLTEGSSRPAAKARRVREKPVAATLLPSEPTPDRTTVFENVGDGSVISVNMEVDDVPGVVSVAPRTGDRMSLAFQAEMMEVDQAKADGSSSGNDTGIVDEGKLKTQSLRRLPDARMADVRAGRSARRKKDKVEMVQGVTARQWRMLEIMFLVNDVRPRPRSRTEPVDWGW